MPPGPDPTEAPGQGGTFSGPVTGLVITWPAEWERFERPTVEGFDRLGLENGFSTMTLSAWIGPDGDVQGCVRGARQDLVDRLDAGTLRGLAPVTDAQGVNVSGVETDRAWLAYRYVSLTLDGEPEIAAHLECRRSGDVLLYIFHYSSPDDYDRASEAREELFTRLTFSEGPRPASTPVPAPTEATAPTTPPATPAPTLNTECEGYPAWHESTLSRVDTLASLRSEETQAAAEVALSQDLEPYRALVKRLALDVERLHVGQAGEVAPVAAMDAQTLAVEMFERFATSAEILSAYYHTNMDIPTLQRAQRAQKAAERAQRDFDDALAAVEGVCG